MNNTSPSLLFGGTWVQLTDTFLYASTTSDSNATTATAGESTHKLSISEMPSHSHNTGYRASYGSGNATALVNQSASVSQGNIATTTTGGGQAHNNMPPYIRVYMWKRTG